jgi:hypothetical protein
MPPRHKWALIIATCIPIAACIFAFSLGPSPEKLLKQFYLESGGEPARRQLLLKAGDRIVPLVIGEVAHKDMPHRRDAIAFLGEGRYRAALGVLELIIRDETEKDFIREDALRAIHLIDPMQGREISQD